MGKKNSQIHLTLETEHSLKLKKEAKLKGLCVNELIRRKLLPPPINEEIILLRKVLSYLTKNLKRLEGEYYGIN